LREQNALPTKVSMTKKLTAKDAIENGGAGRVAKGANPSSCAKEIGTDGFRSYFFMYTEKEEGFEGGSRFARAKRFADESKYDKKVNGKGRH